jgi:hypothetical protein
MIEEDDFSLSYDDLKAKVICKLAKNENSVRRANPKECMIAFMD